MGSLSVIASYDICSSMRQKVNRSVGGLQKVVIYVRFTSFSGGERRRPEVRLLSQVERKNMTVFRIGCHLYKAVTYNFVILILKCGPYFHVSSRVEIC